MVGVSVYMFVSLLSCSPLSLFLYIIGPPGSGTIVPDGLIFYCGCFNYLFCHDISELPRPIAVKLCHVVGALCNASL